MVFRQESIGRSLLKFRAVGRRKLADVSTRYAAFEGFDGLRLQSTTRGLLNFRAVGKRKLAKLSTRDALVGFDGLSATIC